ncbi:uncharacterized protein PHACADRAFT_248486 [Phanerochaete carnosa HHB-10118-sp]|uniref:Uncharacterized protein n=1 Tax=Phanerochaete carnosa (strain HHB-10118-sp) TaxID=650164 RepID=K5WQF7_PHACS|nr:uncharacterized protein PHACADRAFT_248486 [Phanerochaete carnosa HHB-10118-sp]EKM61715.1 hypothetical protein PHACADRAFT_248486 [Phanerochaete carnosa HHB-10118-sp]
MTEFFPLDVAFPQCHTFQVGHIYDSTGVFSWDVLSPRASERLYSGTSHGHRWDILRFVKSLSSLRHLTIASYNVSGIHLSRPYDVLQALAPLQALETLRLAGSSRGNGPHEIPTQVSLPRLRSLVLSGAFRWCIKLLAQLDIPTTTSVRVIEVFFTNFVAQDLLPVLPKIIGVEKDSSAPILSITIHGKADQFANVIVSGWKLLESVLDHRSLPDFSLALPGYDATLDGVLDNLPFGEVRSLFVHGSAFYFVSSWSVRLERNFGNVEELRIGGHCDLYVFHKMLREGTLPRPHTHQLDDVERSHCPRPVLTRGCKHADCFHFLKHILQKRSALGRRISRLILKTKAPLAPPHLAAFSAVVGEVVQRQLPADGAVPMLPLSGDDQERESEPYSSDSTEFDSEEE